MDYRSELSIWSTVVEAAPNNFHGHNALGLVLQSENRLDEAIHHFRQALRIMPDYSNAHNNLGVTLQLQNRPIEAISHFRAMLNSDPQSFDGHNNLGAAFQSLGKLDEAINHYCRAVRISPKHENIHYNLGLALQLHGEPDQAIRHYRQAVQLNPDSAAVHRNLGWILATHREAKIRDPNLSIRHAQRAAELSRYNDPAILRSLAAAYASAQRFKQAVATAKRAISLAKATETSKLVDAMRDDLKLYESEKPYHRRVRTEGAISP